MAKEELIKNSVKAKEPEIVRGVLFPKHLHKKCEAGGFEHCVVQDQDEQDALGSEWKELISDLGIETHPNPAERGMKAKAAAEKAKAEKSAPPSGKGKDK